YESWCPPSQTRLLCSECGTTRSTRRILRLATGATPLSPVKRPNCRFEKGRSETKCCECSARERGSHRNEGDTSRQMKARGTLADGESQRFQVRGDLVSRETD